MAKKSRRHKSQGKRVPESMAAKAVVLAQATHKPWQIALVCVVLAVVTIVAYRGVRNNGFLTYDDNGYVLDNLRIQQGVTPQSIEWAFTSFDAANWHPLTWISHMVDWKLYGGNPSGHHITNVLLHSANAILLFLLLLYMTGYLGRAAMVTFLFALHPAHVESVAWIAERKDILCAFFWFAALLAYAWYVRRPSWKRYACVALAFACALMSKPMAVTFPITLLLLDIWPLRRITFTSETRSHWLSSLWKLCVEKWLFFLLTIASCVVTFLAQRAGGAVAPLESFSLLERLSNTAVSYCRYLRIAFWPNPLTAYYYYDANNIVFRAVLSAVALVVITAVCWHFRKTRTYCLAGWMWFLATLVPVIGIVQVGDQALAERYTYVPFVGIFIAVVWLVGDAVVQFPKIKVAVQLLAVAVIAACAVKTDAQVKVWKNSITLFTHALEVDPRGGPPNLSLGMAYAQQGNIAEAEKYFERALIYHPNGPLTLSYSAYYLMQTHEQRYLPLAEQRLQRALQTDPNYPAALTYMAQWSSLMGRPKDEEMYSRRVLAERPNSIEAMLYLADALQAQGKLDEAAQENRNVLILEPDNYEALDNLGVVFGKQRLTDEALKEFRLSLAIKPDQSAAHSQLGRIFTQIHRYPEAVDEFTKALKYDSAKADAHNDLGVALFQMGDYAKAAEQFSDAVQIDPANAGDRKNLAIAQARIKK